jgi:hypothetical protein
MALNVKIKPYLQRPQGSQMAPLAPDQAAFNDWVQTSLNALIGQQAPPSTGFTALSTPIVNPASAQITSIGSRMQSLATTIKVVPGPTDITFYWDGTNGSQTLTIYRDDYSVITPPKGHLVVSGLTPNTLYYFYPFYDEIAQVVKWIDDKRSSLLSKFTVGTPQVAYPAPSILAAQSQIYQQHISLASSLGAVGITTGTAPTSTYGGGGGGASGYTIPWNLQFPY